MTDKKKGKAKASPRRKSLFQERLDKAFEEMIMSVRFISAMPVTKQVIEEEEEDEESKTEKPVDLPASPHKHNPQDDINQIIRKQQEYKERKNNSLDLSKAYTTPYYRNLAITVGGRPRTSRTFITVDYTKRVQTTECLKKLAARKQEDASLYEKQLRRRMQSASPKNDSERLRNEEDISESVRIYQYDNFRIRSLENNGEGMGTEYHIEKLPSVSQEPKVEAAVKKKPREEENFQISLSPQKFYVHETSPNLSERRKASPKFDETFLAPRKISKSFQELITDQSDGRLNAESPEKTENKSINKTDYLNLVKSLHNPPQTRGFSGSVVGNRLRMPNNDKEIAVPKTAPVRTGGTVVSPDENHTTSPYYLPLWYIP